MVKLKSNPCDGENLDYTLDNQSELSIKNAISCAEKALLSGEVDVLVKHLKFIARYLEQANPLNGTHLLSNLTRSIYNTLRVPHSLNASTIAVMTDLSYILNLLFRKPYALDQKNLVTDLLDVFQVQLNQTAHYLDISGAAKFIHYFRSLFQLYANQLLVSPSAVDLFFQRFKGIQLQFKPLAHQYFNYSSGVILDLYSSLSVALDKHQKESTETDSHFIATLASSIYREAFKLVNHDKKEFYLRFGLIKWGREVVAALAECAKLSQFCDVVDKKTILPKNKTLGIDAEFQSTVYYAGSLDDSMLATL